MIHAKIMLDGLMTMIDDNDWWQWLMTMIDDNDWWY